MNIKKYFNSYNITILIFCLSFLLINVPFISDLNNNKAALSIYVDLYENSRIELLKQQNINDSLNRALKQTKRDYLVYRGLYHLYSKNHSRQDLFVWDPDENKAYYTFQISQKRLQLMYETGKKFNISKDDFSHWMSIPYLETTYGAHRNTRHLKDENNTYITSWADAHGLTGILPRTAYSIMTTKMGYDSSITYNKIIDLLHIDSINVNVAAHFCTSLGFERFTYVHGPSEDLQQYKPWNIKYVKPRYNQ